ncbi:hypothetical protein chiPu_0022896 [Chiloscyllium punctatum]|uniref:Uncharacterized protein n=1 Tax=Chiloscyllium punctatum TaxID=137246 RepID=A0A401T8E1_CHIPU|nr:hypothetical protein [Chiloscyllium punctatum]
MFVRGTVPVDLNRNGLSAMFVRGAVAVRCFTCGGWVSHLYAGQPAFHWRGCRPSLSGAVLHYNGAGVCGSAMSVRGRSNAKPGLGVGGLAYLDEAWSGWEMPSLDGKGLV